MAADAPHHALWEYHALHPAFSTQTTYDMWRFTLCSITHCSPTSSIHTIYGRWRYTPCSMRVSCTTPSIFYTHNIWQNLLCTVFYHTLHHLYLPYTEHITGDNYTMLYESNMHHTLHFLHTPYGKWRSTPCFITHCTFFSIHTAYGSWRFVPCSMTVHLHLPYTAYGRRCYTHRTYAIWRCTPCCITHCTPPSSVHTACSKWRPHHVLWECHAPHVHFPHTQHLAQSI